MCSGGVDVELAVRGSNPNAKFVKFSMSHCAHANAHTHDKSEQSEVASTPKLYSMMTARCARWLLAALCICSALHAACAVPKSKFRREIDFNKLKDVRVKRLCQGLLAGERADTLLRLLLLLLLQDWADEESEDWHEDTYEWKKKLEEKKKANVQFDPQNPAAFMEQAQNPGGMQVCISPR